ncbi:MAG: protein-glutamate O-methyltransferase CheR [Polyangiaceae bacterium]|nr:protein-glutamate O-methyltransferase CheR [Polyangiaceae bacterium]
MATTRGLVSRRFELKPTEFRRIRQLIHGWAGIRMDDTKDALVFSRLAPHLRRLGLATFAQYLDVVAKDATERDTMVSSLTTHETSFFRDADAFAALRETVLAALRARRPSTGVQPRHVRVWCAAASDGQEAYSVAMLLHAELSPEAGWTHEVLATDISTKCVRHTQAGVYASAGNVPRAFAAQYLVSRAGGVQVGPILRSIVRATVHNLVHDALPPGSPFDLILCRNALIYLSAESRSVAQAKLVSALRPGGYLLLGRAESVGGWAHVRATRYLSLGVRQT